MSAITDTIGDYLTRIRNANMAGHRVVEIPASNIKRRITEILYEQGYIFRYKFEETSNGQGVIKIALKYDPVSKKPAINKLVRYSKPGLRQYAKAGEIPRVLNGLGIAIVSTPKGVIIGKDARRLNVGGEVICLVN
ncbi:MAG: 30S ribosomal protein S8 [Chitinophagales bacterium]